MICCCHVDHLSHYVDRCQDNPDRSVDRSPLGVVTVTSTRVDRRDRVSYHRDMLQTAHHLLEQNGTTTKAQIPLCRLLRDRNVPFNPNSITPTFPKLLSPGKFRVSRRNGIWAKGDGTVTEQSGRHSGIWSYERRPTWPLCHKHKQS